MSIFEKFRALVYCENAFQTSNGKTAHGLIRFTERYEVLAVIDSSCAGRDSGEIIDGTRNGIPVLAALEEAFLRFKSSGVTPTHFVIGLAPDGGRIGEQGRQEIKKAISFGLSVDSGLHDFFSEDQELSDLAKKANVKLTDVRKPKPKAELHFFSDKIKDVDSFKIALLGTDSAVGKRTTAWVLKKALEKSGVKTEFVGTGQTAWMQGARYGVVMDSLVNDFVSGEIEHAVWSAWKNEGPEIIVIEGQGSIMNPAYPGGFEIIAAARPDAIIMQHAPARKFYDGFPGYPMDPLTVQIQAVELLSKKRVIAVTLNHEGIPIGDIQSVCEKIERDISIRVFDVLAEGGERLAELVKIKSKNKGREF